MFPISPEDELVRKGKICTHVSIHYGNVEQGFRQSEAIVEETFHTPRGSSFLVFPSLAFSAQVAEVEINPETGEVRVICFTAVHDCGLVINPQNVEGQIEGGISRGLGFALLEESINDLSGRIMNPSFAMYTLLWPQKPPGLRALSSRRARRWVPSGPKGWGEPAIISTTPAIANAIYDAIGVMMKELPITPEKVLKGLYAKK
jgi:CO/xanthine dehydrogenase Mo-binding subunit